LGKELSRRPRRIEFKTLKELNQYLEVEASTRHLTVRIPTWMYEAIKRLVENGKFKSRTELIKGSIGVLGETWATLNPPPPVSTL